MTPFSHAPDLLGEVILCRFLIAGTKGADLAGIEKDLMPLLPVGLAREDARARLEAIVARLVAAGHLAPLPTKGKKPPKRPKLAVTDAGQRHALDFLGLSALPAKFTWKKVREDHLVPHALGLPPGSKPAAQKAALLQRHYGLHPGPKATAAELKARLVWRLLDLPEKPGLKVDDLMVALAERTTGRKLTAKTAVGALTAAAAGTSDTKDSAILEAALRGWIHPADPHEAAPAAPPTHPAPHVQAPPEPLPLEAFADRVVAAARASTTGRFGSDKVFLSHVWNTLQASRSLPGLDRAAFDDRLLEAHRAGALQLSRADLVEAMNPADVADSEIQSGISTYHFLRLPWSPQR